MRKLLVTVYVVVACFYVGFVFGAVGVIILTLRGPTVSSVVALIRRLISLTVVCVLALAAGNDLIGLYLTLYTTPLLIILKTGMVLCSGGCGGVTPVFGSMSLGVTPSLVGLKVRFFVVRTTNVVRCRLVGFLVVERCKTSRMAYCGVSCGCFDVLAVV